MKTLMDQPTREAVLVRVARLTPAARPRWGSLTVDRMIVHLIDGLKIAFGELSSEFQPSFFSTRLGRWMVIDAPSPWPKGRVRAPEAFFRTQPGEDIESDRRLLVEYVKRFAAGRDQRWGTSPMFGSLNADQWARLNYRHLDHHLRQFGA